PAGSTTVTMSAATQRNPINPIPDSALPRIPAMIIEMATTAVPATKAAISAAFAPEAAEAVSTPAVSTHNAVTPAIMRANATVMSTRARPDFAAVSRNLLQTPAVVGAKY